MCNHIHRDSVWKTKGVGWKIVNVNRGIYKNRRIYEKSILNWKNWNPLYLYIDEDIGGSIKYYETWFNTGFCCFTKKYDALTIKHLFWDINLIELLKVEWVRGRIHKEYIHNTLVEIAIVDAWREIK